MGNGDTDALAGVPSPTNPGGQGDPSQMPPSAGAAPQPTTGTQPQPQANAAQPAQAQPDRAAAAPAAPPKPGSFFHNVSHAFIGAVLGQAIEDGPNKGKRVGGTTGSYTAVTDPNTGEIKMAPVPMTIGQRMQGLATRMLSGLANVPDTPENPSPIKGFGQGFKGVQDEKEAAMKKSKEAAEEDYKRAQDLKMQKYDIAFKNMQTQHAGVALLKLRNDMNPLIPESRAIMEAVKNSPDLAGWQVQEVTASQLHDMMADGHLTNSQILPLEFQPIMDGENVRMSADGTPASEQHFGIVTGPVGSQHSGNIIIPAAIAKEFKDFGEGIGQPNLKSFEAGSEMPVRKFVQVMGQINEERAKIVNGWNVPKIVDGPDGKPMFVNSYKQTLEPRPATYLDEGYQEAKGKEKLQEAQAGEARGKEAEARYNAGGYANQLLGARPGTPEFKQAWDGMTGAIAQLPPDRRAGAAAVMNQAGPQNFPTLLAASNGDLDPKQLISMGRGNKPVPGRWTSQEFHRYMLTLNPQYFDGMFDEKKKVMASFASGKDGQAVDAINNFGRHLGTMKDTFDKWSQSNSPILNMTLAAAQQAYANTPELAALQFAVAAPVNEWSNVVKNGHASDAAETDASHAMLNPNSTIGQIMAAGGVMAEQVFGRLQNLDEKWQRAWGYGGHYSHLVTAATADGLKKYGLGDQIAPYVGGSALGGVISNIQGGGPQAAPQTPVAPTPQSHVFDAGKFKRDNPTANVDQAIKDATAAGYQIIGVQ